MLTAVELELGPSDALQAPQVGWRRLAVSSPNATVWESDFGDDLEFARGQFRERLSDPRAFVLAPLNAPRLHQGIGVLVPAALGEVMAEHRGRSLRLLHDTERHIDLCEPQEGFLDVARPLVARHHHLEAIDGAYVVVRVLQLTPNIHFLARQLIARDLDLAFGGDGIFGFGIFADHLFEALGPPYRCGPVRARFRASDRNRTSRSGTAHRRHPGSPDAA